MRDEVLEPGFADLDTIVTVDNDDAFRTYPLGTETSGSPFASLSICWGHAPASVADYVVRVGELQVLGAAAGTFACTLGRSCVLQVTGLQLASTNVAESQPWSVAEWTGALRFYNPRSPCCTSAGVRVKRY